MYFLLNRVLLTYFNSVVAPQSDALAIVLLNLAFIFSVYGYKWVFVLPHLAKFIVVSAVMSAEILYPPSSMGVCVTIKAIVLFFPAIFE